MAPRSVGDALLATPICELGLELSRSRFWPLIERVRRELDKTGIALRPRFYLSTEYGCITGTATIGLLFTDGFAHTQRVAKLAGLRTRSPALVLPTLRHEVGHAFCYAHRLYRDVEFRRLFGVRGHFFRTYPEGWKPKAKDRARVDRGEVIFLYATRHPDEDFAISFQTWLASAAYGRDYRRAWLDKPIILRKLDYVARIVAERGHSNVDVKEPPFDEPISEVPSTFAEWIARVHAGNNYNLLPDSPVAQQA